MKHLNDAGQIFLLIVATLFTLGAAGWLSDATTAVIGIMCILFGLAAWFCFFNGRYPRL